MSYIFAFDQNEYMRMGLGRWKIYTQLRVNERFTKTPTKTSNHMTKHDQCMVLKIQKNFTHR